MTLGAMKYIEDDKPVKPLSLSTVRRDYYGKKAFEYDLGREDSQKWQLENQSVNEFLKDKYGKILDIPCGTGRFFSLYREYGLQFIGMDVSEDMMCQARAKDDKAEVIFGDIEHIPLEDKAVDYSLCVRLLDKIEEKEMMQAVVELGRVTSKAMLFTVITGPERQRRNRSWVHREGAMMHAIKEAGFKPIKAYEIRAPEMHAWECERI